MRKNRLHALAVAAAALCLIGAGRNGEGNGGSQGNEGRGGGGGFHGGGGGSHPAPATRSVGRPASTIYRRQRVQVTRPSMPARETVFRDQNRAVYPQRGGVGARITQRDAAVPPAHHLAVVQNSGVVRNIHRQQRSESTPNHYYWHNDHGIRYSHYYDGQHHWYGFYHGPTFYWTRYHDNRWWWYDSSHSRWDFWGNEHWWWVDPAGAPYVYIDNGYYPYQDSGVTVEQAEDQPAPESIPAPDPSGAKDSPDGRRTVQIVGAGAQAFLYDKTASPPVFLKYLGQGVSQVRFSGGNAGAPLQILVEYNDGTFAVFDADGNSRSAAAEPAAAKSAAPSPPTDSPDSIPPPPSSAPGQ